MLADRVTTLDHLAAYTSANSFLTGRGDPQQVPALSVSPNFFATLGVTPALGRPFLTGSGAPDDDRSAIISERLWRREFDSDPGAVGRTVTLNGRPFTVIGVTAPGFTGYSFASESLWVPLTAFVRSANGIQSGLAPNARAWSWMP